MNDKQRLLASLVSVAGLVGIWYLGSSLVSSRTFPNPVTVVLATIGILNKSEFYVALVETIAQSFSGLVLGILFSYVFALTMVQSDFLDRSIRPMLNFIRSIPAIVLIPLFLVVIGAGYFTVIAITAFAVFSKLVIFALDGVRSVANELKDISEISKLNRFQKFLLFQLPASTQFILSGIQLSVSRAYGIVVLCGLLIGAPGLGRSLREAGDNARYDEIFAYGLLLALLGVLLYMALLRLETITLRTWGLVR